MVTRTNEIEIVATYLREHRRKGDWCIAIAWIEAARQENDICGEVQISLECEPDELKPEQEYLWVGTWKQHPKFGLQFHASSFVLRQPHGRTGIIAYLAAAGEGNGMGKGKAAALWELYGTDAVTMMRTQPLVCVQELYKRKLYLHEEQALAIAKKLEEESAVEACTLDLLDVLANRGFPKSTPRNCLREWGAKASQVVRRDPYKLMLFKGCGFRRCDAAYLELGLNPTRLKRQALAAWYTVASNSDGHTWHPLTVATFGIKKYIGAAKVEPGRAIKLALGRNRRGRILADARTKGVDGPLSSDGKFEWVAEATKAASEAELARLVVDAMGEANTWPK